MSVTSNLTINFGEETVEEAGFISIELDDETNGGNTVFDIGGTAYLLVYCNDEYEYEGSGGTLKKEDTDIPLEIVDEYITFARADSGQLAYIPHGSVSYEWVGNDAGNPIFSGREIILSESSVAVLRCSYTAYGDRFSLTLDEEGIVVVVATSGDDQASLLVNFETETADPVPYNINVSDYCSDDDLPDVEVTITTDGSPMEGEVLAGGTTDENGEVYLGMLIPGRQYNLFMTCSGYLDSDVDILNNDYFVVPEEE